MGRIASLENDAVVLIGVQGLFAAAFTAKAQPTERHARVALVLDGQFDHSAHGVVVEQGDDLGDLRRRRPMGQHAFDQLADFTAQRYQAFDARGMANGSGQMDQVDPLQGEQVTLGDHAAQAFVFHQADVGDVPLGHGNGCIEGAGLGAQVERVGGHVAANGLGKVGTGVGHHLAQVAQGEDTNGKALGIDDHDAAHLLFMHQGYRLAQWCLPVAHHRVAHGQFAQAGVERVLRAQGLYRAALDLLVDLVEQAADAAQGEVAKGFGQGEQADERRLVQLQAKGVFGGEVFGAGGAFAQQGGERKALAAGDLEGGFGAGAGHVLALTDHTPLLDDVKVLNRAVAGLDDAVFGCIEAQLALLHQKRQVGVFHQVERWKALQKLQGPLDVLQYCSLSCLGEGVHFAHEHLPRLLCRHMGRRPCCFRLSWSDARRPVPIGRKSKWRDGQGENYDGCQILDDGGLQADQKRSELDSREFF
ncbi:hypothetical protein D3C77_291640 [compost metagenome]